MKISVVIPVLNEASSLPGVLRGLKEAPGAGPLEVIVADGGSRDGSAEAARPFADKVVASPQPGRAAQMHAGALAATGDLLLFLHADTLLPPGWPAVLRTAWAARPRPAATAFRVAFDKESWVYHLIAWATAVRLKFTRVPHGDQAVAVSREDYFAVGGFPEVPLMEEYYLARKLRRRGEIRILPQTVTTSARRYEKNGPLLNALRNTFLVTLFQLGVPPARLARLYR